MKRTDAMFWLSYLTCHLHRTQQKTIAAIVQSVVGTERVTIASVGRRLACQTRLAAKHTIKRVDRFLSNGRIEPTTAMAGTIRWLAGPSKRLMVSMDWVDIRSFHCLMLAAWYRGRAVPLLWHVTRWDRLHKSRNSLEYGLLRVLRSILPSSVQVTVLADRGFGRTEFARVCQSLTFHYIVRIAPSVYITHHEFTGRLQALPIRRGQQRCLRGVRYRKHRPVLQNVAVYWNHACREPWYLMTDLPRLQSKTLTRFYRRRMTIEEYFRDLKNRRTGWGLRMTLIRRADRLTRWLLVLALAYLLMIAIGRYIASHDPPRSYCSNNRPGECSYFYLAFWALQTDRSPPIRLAMNQLRNDITQQFKKENWG